MSTEIPESARNALAVFEEKKREFDALLNEEFLRGHIRTLGIRMFGLEDTSEGFVFHPEFEKVLIEKYADYLLKRYAARISAQIDKDVRTAAKEQARIHVHQLMAAELYKLKGDRNLKERAQELISSMDALIDDIGHAKDNVQKICNEVEKFRNLEFVRGVSGSAALVSVKGERELTQLLPTFEKYDTLLQRARTAMQEAVKDNGANAGDKLITALEQAYGVMGTYFPDRGRLSMAIADAYKEMTVTINAGMLDAYIYHDVAEANFQAVKKIVETGTGLTDTVLKTSNYSGFFVRLVDLVNIVGNRLATERAIKQGAGKFRQEKAAGSLFKAYENNPELLFQRLHDNQRAALEILLAVSGVVMSGSLTLAPGVGEVATKVFDLVAGAVTAVVDEVLKRRADAAMEEIRKLGIPEQKDGEQSYWTRAGEIWDAKCQDLSEEIKDKLRVRISASAISDAVSPDTALGVTQAAYNPGEEGEPGGTEFSPFALAGLLEDLIIPPVTKYALQFVRIKPAQFFTGTDLATMLTGINRAQLPVGFLLEQSRKPNDPPARLTAQSYDGPVPTEIGGHKVIWTDANRSKLDGDRGSRHIYAALDIDGVKVWGRWYVQSEKWEACDIHQDTFADWSGTVVIGRDAIEVNGVKQTGSWHALVSPEKNYTYIGFQDAGKVWRIGHFMDLTKGAARTPEYTLGAQTEGFWVRRPIGDHFWITSS
ncbi:hypothetical protein OG352_08135 [Streptomyces sp. NBC_01485]|uniref:hypothetical protein n=1 Tax=Streptomyces sp. NBC_01485 TaxID=2903884 RepID=UPI002E33F1DD|nr:hypothetical protein [Streptomyces sp. NBC_01485]